MPAVLSGHTHGGQVVIPGVGALRRRATSRCSQGSARSENTSIFVSRGIGTVYVPVRINCPPEVAIVTLQRATLSAGLSRKRRRRSASRPSSTILHRLGVRAMLLDEDARRQRLRACRRRAPARRAEA